MKKHFWPFVYFWILNSILLYVAAWIYPYYFVLGNKSMTMFWAAVASGFIWTFITWFTDPILGQMFKIKSKLIMFGFYFLANFVALWITARMAPVAGFGAVSFVWLVFLAIIADFIQWGLWKVGSFKKMLR